MESEEAVDNDSDGEDDEEGGASSSAEAADQSFSLPGTGESGVKELSDLTSSMEVSREMEVTGGSGLLQRPGSSVALPTSMSALATRSAGDEERRDNELPCCVPTEKDVCSSFSRQVKDDDGTTEEVETHSPLVAEDDSSSEDESESDSTDSSLPGDTASVVSGASSVAPSYIYTEEGASQMRRLVHRSLVKRQKEQQRLTRPKKETKRVAAGSQKREKRAHKMKIKESLSVGFF